MKKSNYKYFIVFIFIVQMILYHLPAYTQQFAVQLDKMNVVYIGLPNPIHITSKEVNCKNIILKVSDGKLEGTGCNYLYTCEKVGKVIFKIYKKGQSGIKLIGDMDVRVKRVPEAQITVAGRRGGSISRAALAIAIGPIVEMPFAFDYDLRPLITKCTITILCGHDGATLFERTFESSKGVVFDEETTSHFKEMEQGDIVILRNITSTHPTMPTYPDVKYTVTH